MKDSEQINTAIPMVVGRENYADRLARWMEDERRRERDALSGKLAEAVSNSFAEAVSNALMALALAKESKYRWIPVTERLPEEGTRCLVYVGRSGRPEAEISEHMPPWRNAPAGWVDRSGFVITNLVTHWMPLPEPPK